jgi:hypothetical protein
VRGQFADIDVSEALQKLQANGCSERDITHPTGVEWLDALVVRASPSFVLEA